MEHPQKTENPPNPPPYTPQAGITASAPYPQYPGPPLPVYQQLIGFNQNAAYNNVNSSNMVMVQPSQVQPIYLGNRTYLNFTGAIVLSCMAYWCFGALFGFIAFIVALIGQSSAASGDETSARSMLIASYVLSTIGIVLGILAIIGLIVYFTVFFKPITTYNSNSDSNTFGRNFNCMWFC